MNASKGCGCGGSGGCGCGGATAVARPAVWGCSACGGRGCGRCRGGAFVRPSFFGGQLLTEDDLQALIQFVVDKNRLHNRALFGAGVVCGLEVACDPCDPKQLTLSAGYALDCCGNDIVVTCPDTIDVMRLVQELRTRMVGKDCGDPCKDTKDPTDTTDPGNGFGVVKPLRRERCEEYCLYIKYCEQEAEPIAPYATDDCTPAGCKPTRIYEGYELELRCPTRQVRPSMDNRRRACVGDDRQLAHVVKQAAVLEQMWRPVVAATPRILGTEHAKRIELPPLAHAVERLGTIIALPQLEATDVAEALEHVIAIAAHQVRSDHGDKDTKVELAKVQEGTSLTKAGEVLKKAFGTLDEPLLASWGREVVNHLASGNLPRRGSLEHELLLQGAFVSQPMMQASYRPMQDLRGWVTLRAASPGQTQCLNAKRVAAAALSVAEEPRVEPASVAAYAYAAHEISLLTNDEVRRCACEALNPPCTPCDDPAVLLACITVEDCQVVSICNTVRDYVITGPNIRYWFPAIFDSVFERARRICCADPCGKRDDNSFHLREMQLLQSGIEQPDTTVERLQREVASLTEQVKQLLEAAPKKKGG